MFMNETDSRRKEGREETLAEVVGVKVERRHNLPLTLFPSPRLHFLFQK